MKFPKKKKGVWIKTAIILALALLASSLVSAETANLTSAIYSGGDKLSDVSAKDDSYFLADMKDVAKGFYLNFSSDLTNGSTLNVFAKQTTGITIGIYAQSDTSGTTPLGTFSITSGTGDWYNTTLDISTPTNGIWLGEGTGSGQNPKDEFDFFSATIPSACTANLTNTSWSSWTNITCLANDTMNQSRNLTQYDANVCGGANTTFTEYRATEFCDYCTPSLTNTSWTSWYNTSSCYANDTIDQERNLTEYDGNYCGEVSNSTYFEYQTAACDYCTPNLINTSTAWTNISCLVSDLMNQTRNTTQYDNNYCGEIANQTFVEYQATEFCDYCTPSLINTSWTEWYNLTGCQANDTVLQERNLTQYDSNSCGEVANTTFTEQQSVACDYCTPSLTNTSWNSWLNISCLSDDTMNQSRNLTQYDTNSCGEIANQTFIEYRNTEACDYCTPSLTNTSWSSWNNISCLSDNTMNQSRNLTQYDSNSCGEIANQTFTEYQNIEACDYCTPNLLNTSWTAWYNLTGCQANDTVLQERNLTQYDSNVCGEFANQTFTEQQSAACIYQVNINETVEDASSNPINTTIIIIDESDNSTVYNQTANSHNLNVDHNKEYTIRIVPQNNKIKEIEFTNVNITEPLNQIIDIDNPADNQGYIDLYAINPLINLSPGQTFTVTVTASATSNVLYKCVDWNFTSRTCEGTWILSKIINPGQDYIITLNSTDPGFGEDNITANLTSAIHVGSDVLSFLISKDDNYYSADVKDASKKLYLNFTHNITNQSILKIYAKQVNGITVGIYAQSDTLGTTPLGNFTVTSGTGDWYNITLDLSTETNAIWFGEGTGSGTDPKEEFDYVYVEIFIANSLPNSTTPIITPATAYTNNNLNCTFTVTDEDNDSLSVNYTWYNGSTLVITGTMNVTNGTLTSISLGSANTSKGETWNCSIIPFDGIAYGIEKSITKTIQNSLPTSPIIDLLPNNPNADQDLVASITSSSSDLDNDTITYSYEWYKNNILQPGLTTNTISHVLTTAGEIWKAVVTPNDGESDGATGEDNETIVGVPPQTSNIKLMSPINHYIITSSTTVTFNYNVSNNVTNCSLVINGTVDQTNTNITPNTTETFTKTLANGDYNWSVECTNPDNSTNSSITWDFTLDYTAPVKKSGGGGGSSSAPVIVEECLESWTCTSWSDCANDQQTRLCFDFNECGTETLKPEEIRSCEANQNNGDGLAENETKGSGIPSITGEAIKVLPYKGPNPYYLLPTILLLIIFITLTALKKSHLSKTKKKVITTLHITLASLILILFVSSFIKNLPIGAHIAEITETANVPMKTIIIVIVGVAFAMAALSATLLFVEKNKIMNILKKRNSGKRKRKEIKKMEAKKVKPKKIKPRLEHHKIKMDM
ncbi:MAG: hypothetical protein V3V78_03360, partial [Candidatus Woesearchaeota archaeon]